MAWFGWCSGATVAQPADGAERHRTRLNGKLVTSSRKSFAGERPNDLLLADLSLDLAPFIRLPNKFIQLAATHRARENVKTQAEFD